MTELLTAAQMGAIEQAAIESGQVTGLELMERAGLGVFDAIFEQWPELANTQARAVVLCGPGNNGGDGFVIARLLKRWGWEVDVFLYGDPEKLPPDARVNYDRWSALGRCRELTDATLEGYTEDHPDALLAIDALFGTGLSRPVLVFPKVIQELNRWQSSWQQQAVPRVVCVDIPSGVCADSGRSLVSGEPKWQDTAIKGNLTVCFYSLKLGHVLADGPMRCGAVSVVDIGLPNDRDLNKEIQCAPGLRATGQDFGSRACQLIDVARLPSLQKRPSDHKYANGHALIISGRSGKTGAARLAARGALRVGAGLVTLAVPPAAQLEVAGQITAIMLQRVEGAAALSELLQDSRLNALCLGPALGLDRARALVPAALSAGRNTVLDADALSAFSEHPTELFELLHDGCVLTPHQGEFARLFPDISKKLDATATKGPAYSKVDAAREAASRAGCVVLFKGPDTVVAAPDGQCSVNAANFERSAPWLATAGSGDVLAGFITGLLARGIDPMQAAETAAWLHVECARAFGPGLIAEDIPEQLPIVLQRQAL